MHESFGHPWEPVPVLSSESTYKNRKMSGDIGVIVSWECSECGQIWAEEYLWQILKDQRFVNHNPDCIKKEAFLVRKA